MELQNIFNIHKMYWKQWIEFTWLHCSLWNYSIYIYIFINNMYLTSLVYKLLVDFVWVVCPSINSLRVTPARWPTTAPKLHGIGHTCANTPCYMHELWLWKVLCLCMTGFNIKFHNWQTLLAIYLRLTLPHYSGVTALLGVLWWLGLQLLLTN